MRRDVYLCARARSRATQPSPLRRSLRSASSVSLALSRFLLPPASYCISLTFSLLSLHAPTAWSIHESAGPLFPGHLRNKAKRLRSWDFENSISSPSLSFFVCLPALLLPRSRFSFCFHCCLSSLLLTTAKERRLAVSFKHDDDHT